MENIKIEVYRKVILRQDIGKEVIFIDAVVKWVPTSPPPPVGDWGEIEIIGRNDTKIHGKQMSRGITINMKVFNGVEKNESSRWT